MPAIRRVDLGCERVSVHLREQWIPEVLVDSQACFECRFIGGHGPSALRLWVHAADILDTEEAIRSEDGENGGLCSRGATLQSILMFPDIFCISVQDASGVVVAGLQSLASAVPGSECIREQHQLPKIGNRHVVAADDYLAFLLTGLPDSHGELRCRRHTKIEADR